jgi:hypothetical protein
VLVKSNANHCSIIAFTTESSSAEHFRARTVHNRLQGDHHPSASGEEKQEEGHTVLLKA